MDPPQDANTALVLVNALCNRRCQDTLMTSLVLRSPYNTIPVSSNPQIFNSPPWELDFFPQAPFPQEKTRSWIFQHTQIPQNFRRMNSYHKWYANSYERLLFNRNLFFVRHIFLEYTDRRHYHGVEVCSCNHVLNKEYCYGWKLFEYKYGQHSMFLLNYKESTKDERPRLQKVFTTIDVFDGKEQYIERPKKKGKPVSGPGVGQGVALVGGQGGVREEMHSGIIASDSNENGCVSCVSDESLEFEGMREGYDGNPRDNVTARLYVDPRCVYFQKPLLESGTLGAKCNTQMVVPHLIENYSASRNPPEKQAPMCTVHSFPCVRFEDYFVNCVKQLIYTFPEDAATSTGAPFWSAAMELRSPLVVRENTIASASSRTKKLRIDHTESKSDGRSALRLNSNVGGNEARLNMNNLEIDEDLHSSRQLAIYGRETVTRLFSSSVLISGVQGLGVEIAKNIILAGVKSVTLHDENVVELWDLSSNFVFTDEDIGKNRALASVHKLQELNNAVAVSTLTEKLTKEQLSDFQAVVFVDTSFEKAAEFDDYCHSHQPPIAFIKADVRGLFGSLFCDFGPHFTVLDVDGEEPHSGIIASFSNESPGCVSCVDDERLEFEDGNLVVFSEVEVMTELNDGKPRKIKNVKPYSFTLEEDTTSYGDYMKGGIVTQVKQPKVLRFKPLREALKDPGEFLLSDFSKFDRPPLLHLAFQALDRFSSQTGRFPVAGSEEDAQKLMGIAIDINESMGDARLEDVNSKLLRHLAFGSRAVLNPMAAMFGGIVGQEVVKACSGKFHPLFQFFYFDSVESLPKEPLDASEFSPQNSRYDAQISVFGSTLQKKLENARVFVVGAGALGCEFLKNMNKARLNMNNLEIDEDLHSSRQLAVSGRETVTRLFSSSVLISGVQGLGVEIAKNMILAGVKSVTLHDENVVGLWDLSSNVVYTDEDMINRGKSTQDVTS